MLKRYFSSSFAAKGLFTDYIKTLKVNEITPSQLSAKVSKPTLKKASKLSGFPENFHILDCREVIEYNQDFIPYSHYTGRGNLERDIEGLIPNVNDEIVLYCAGGFRSQIAADTLTKMGYKNVSSLKGGLGAWKNEGNPVVLSSQAFSDPIQRLLKVEENAEKFAKTLRVEHAKSGGDSHGH